MGHKQLEMTERLLTSLGLPRWRWWSRSHLQCWRQKKRGFDPWVGKVSWRRKWQPTPVFFPGESYGQRSLAATVRGVTKSQTRLSTQCSPADVQLPRFMLRFLRQVDCVQLLYSLRLFACMSFSQSIKMQRQTSHSVAH